MNLIKYIFIIIVNVVILLSFFIEELKPVVLFAIIAYLVFLLIKCIRDNKGRKNTWRCKV